MLVMTPKKFHRAYIHGAVYARLGARLLSTHKVKIVVKFMIGNTKNWSLCHCHIRRSISVDFEEPSSLSCQNLVYKTLCVIYAQFYVLSAPYFQCGGQCRSIRSVFKIKLYIKFNIPERIDNCYIMYYTFYKKLL